jgi:hypothetical protein
MGYLDLPVDPKQTLASTRPRSEIEAWIRCREVAFLIQNLKALTSIYALKTLLTLNFNWIYFFLAQCLSIYIQKGEDYSYL